MTSSIQIRSCGDAVYFSEITHDMFCDPRLPNHGLIYVRSGILRLETATEHIEARAGDYIFCPRNCMVGMKKMSDRDTPFRSIAITFDSKVLRRYFSAHLQNRCLPKKVLPIFAPAVPLPHNIKLDSLFMSLLPYADQGIDPDEETIENIRYAAIRCLLEIDERMYPTLFDFYEIWKIDLRDFMEKHFMECLSIEEFASYTGRSLATFKRDFAKISAQTPSKWIIQKRLELAAQLLSDSHIKPSSVYQEVGFKNRSHFHTHFKRHYGLSPAAYQKQFITEK